MTKPISMTTGPTDVLKVLSLSPLEEDHASLQAIVGHSKWMLCKAANLASARTLLEQHEIAVVVCERELHPGTYVDVLELMTGLPKTPALIVTSRLADDKLWSEALNLGAWDVLAKPFERTEVVRSVKSGWQHWYDQIHQPARVMRVSAAS